VAAVNPTTVSYNICVSADIEDSKQTCTSTSSGTGKLDPVLKKWTFSRTGSDQENYFVAFSAKNGKKVAFIDLRDRYGITQIVFDPDVTKDFSEIENVKRDVSQIIRYRLNFYLYVTNPAILTGSFQKSN
jgi:hypothetical protein